MATITQKQLFIWQDIEDLGDLERLKLALDYLPDEELVSILEAQREKGRNEYPVRAVWNSVIAGVVYEHVSIESLRRELLRNAQLRQLCGFDVLSGIKSVPSSSAFSRFLKNLLNNDCLIDDMFNRLVEKLKDLLPELGKYLAFDGKRITYLWDKYNIKPVIDIRNMWGKDETRIVSGFWNAVYNYKGDVFCVCPKTGCQKTMGFGGFEKKRKCLKYRCPAIHYGVECKGMSLCSLSKSIRIPLSENRRIFAPLARSTYKWNKIYNMRSSVERVNSRLDLSFGFERHFIRGLKKMKVRCGIALCTMLSMAVGRIKQNREDLMRSLVRLA